MAFSFEPLRDSTNILPRYPRDFSIYNDRSFANVYDRFQPRFTTRLLTPFSPLNDCPSSTSSPLSSFINSSSSPILIPHRKGQTRLCITRYDRNNFLNLPFISYLFLPRLDSAIFIYLYPPRARITKIDRAALPFITPRMGLLHLRRARISDATIVKYYGFTHKRIDRWVVERISTPTMNLPTLHENLISSWWRMQTVPRGGEFRYVLVKDSWNIGGKRGKSGSILNSVIRSG